ncbi:MAG: efflux transporter outer membrane subunit [Burkholderiales bacterium]
MYRRAILVAAALLAGCATPAPEYRRPAVELPAAWRDSAPAAYTNGRWWQVYGDAALERLVDEAIAGSADLALAAARVDEARALLRETGAGQAPTLDANASRDRSRSSAATGLLPPGAQRERNNTRLTLDVAYEVDLWGRLRTASEAARADLLATTAARETVRIALVADVARSWSALRALDASAASTRRALALREELLALQKKRSDAGLISEFELRQLEAEAAAARAQLAPIERDREREEAVLAVLLGRSPKAIMESGVQRAADATDAPPALQVPAGLPSELLLRRPDLVEAEQRLLAANARVELARLAYFPSIPLTGFVGTESATLSQLFSGPATIWRIAAAVAQPIFDGGRRDAQREAAEARERQALAQYQRAIRNAFGEVRQALAAQARSREAYDAEGARMRALAEALRLAQLRLKHGLASQLEVIDAERNLLAAELSRIDALRAQRAAVADLFKALGG